MHMPTITRQEFIVQYIQRSRINPMAIRSHGYVDGDKVCFAVPTESTAPGVEGWQMVSPAEYLDRLEWGLPV